MTWPLSPGAGVKYLGVWVVDGAGNVSQLDELSLAFANRLASQEPLASDQRHQYRFRVDPGTTAVFNVIAESGDPDLFVWKPRTGRLPQYMSMGSGLLDAVALRAEMDGVYLVEVSANGDSAYTFLVPGSASAADSSPVPSGGAADKTRPEHPLTLTTPLTAGVGAAPELELRPIYLPIIGR